MINKTTLGRCKNSKKRYVQYPGKRTFGSCFWNGSTENFEIMFLDRCLIKNAALSVKYQDVWLLCLTLEKFNVDLAAPVYSIRQPVFCVHMRFFCTKLNRMKQKMLNATFWIGYSKNLLSKFLVEPVQIAESKRSFSGMKILEETWAFMNVCNG